MLGDGREDGDDGICSSSKGSGDAFSNEPLSVGAAPRSSKAHLTGVHSFEVRLVLEFCDKGDLRRALGAGLFFTGE